MILLAVDTGKTVGLAEWQGDVHVEWDLPGDEAMDYVAGRLQHPTALDEVVVEELTINAHSHTKSPGLLEAVEQLGLIRHLCRWQGIEFALQSPAEAKRFGTDKKLRALEWWTPSPRDHARSASRHLLTRLCTVDAKFATMVASKV